MSFQLDEADEVRVLLDFRSLAEILNNPSELDRPLCYPSGLNTEESLLWHLGDFVISLLQNQDEVLELRVPSLHLPSVRIIKSQLNDVVGGIVLQ